MDFSLVTPAIVIVVYCIAEILKKLACKTDDQKTLLPIICILLGAVIGVVVFLLYPEGISATNILEAITTGGLSGASATGCNQLYKQLTKLTSKSDTSDS